MDYLLLSRIVDELAPFLAGARVERVYRGTDANLYIQFRRERRDLVLLLSPDRVLPRIHLVRHKPPASDTGHPFVLFLRSRLTGTRVASIALLNQDRIVEMRLGRQGRQYRLIFELTGSATNLMLVDESGTILAAHHPVPPSDQAPRTVAPGARYVLPVNRAHRIENKEAAPASGAWAADGGEAIAHENGDRLAFNRAAETSYEQAAAQKALASRKTALRARITKALKKTDRLRGAIESDLRMADRADDYRRAGELILAHIHDLETAGEQVELVGFDDRRMTVRLDPQLTPAGNAGRYFKKYKKAKAGRSIMETRLREAEAAAARFAACLSDLEAAREAETLERIESRLEDGDSRKRRGPNKPPAKPAVTPGTREVVFRGWVIVIGKSAAGNDYLTTKLARPDDLWLHAEGLPGSHVLIRNPGRTEVPDDVLNKAAELAAYYSKGRAAGKVAVAYTRARSVKKPKGAKPGLVTLSERKTVMAVPRPDGPQP